MITEESTSPPSDRYCDIVMKGGVTSGVVYPPAIVELSKHYHFKNIGGTSAGAIAAALTAAAEYQRRQSGSRNGFNLLGELPGQLGDERDGRTQLFRLFQPDRPCARLFGILTGSLNATGTWNRIRKIVCGCVVSYWAVSLLGALVAAAVGWATSSLGLAVLTALVALPVAVTWRIYRDLATAIVDNNFGMCRGLTTRPTWGDALTPWLHGLIQEAAGLPPQTPLTFGHLWSAKGGPGQSSSARSIDLQMFTTNLSHGRPYMLPHVEPTARLFFRRDQLQSYLPSDVMTWFNDHSVDYLPNARLPNSDPPVELALELGLKEIPRAADFPVLLAVRMSLSFPLLFSTVPLWAIDYEQAKGSRDFKRCLFSDGGISSNFPMHLFDGLVPQWPTFGFDLEAELRGRESVFLPVRYMQGIADRWTRFDAKTGGMSRFGGFLMSIAGAMQNWNDNTQARSAGVRDRVVRIRLSKEQGGMNLNMPPEVIKELAARGRSAAKELIVRYLGPTPPEVPWDGWSQQRLARLDVFLYSLDQKLPGLLKALGAGVPYSRSFDDLIKAGSESAFPGHESVLSPKQQEALRDLMQALANAAVAFESGRKTYAVQPLPEPELRTRSVL